MSTIDAETLRSWLEAGRRVIVLDVRSAADRATWAIPGSLHVDAYTDLKAHNPHALDDVSLPADVPVVGQRDDVDERLGRLLPARHRLEEGEVPVLAGGNGVAQVRDGVLVFAHASTDARPRASHRSRAAPR